MTPKKSEEKISDVQNINLLTKKIVSVNVKQYCNVQFPYDKVEDLNPDEILADLVFWHDLITEFEKTKNDKPVETPGEIEVIKKWGECGSYNLIYTTGTGKNNKVWHAFECQDCTQEYQGKPVKTKNWTSYKKTTVDNLVDEDDLPDDDVPF